MSPANWLMIARTERANLAAFLSNAVRLDSAAAVRLRRRPDRRISVWTATGLEVLAGRAVDAVMEPADITLLAADLAHRVQFGVTQGVRGELVELGYSMDSAWRGALPPDTGFAHVDDIDGAEIRRLAHDGAELAKQAGTPGIPVALLDQQVLTVQGAGQDVTVPMRMIFALTGMGFLPAEPEPGDTFPDVVRVRATPTWLRLDARHGSIARYRGLLGITPN